MRTGETLLGGTAVPPRVAFPPPGDPDCRTFGAQPTWWSILIGKDRRGEQPLRHHSSKDSITTGMTAQGVPSAVGRKPENVLKTVPGASHWRRGGAVQVTGVTEMFPPYSVDVGPVLRILHEGPLIQ